MQATLVSDLCAAAFSGNVSALKALLLQGADVNGMDATGMTALTRACIAGHDKVVEALLAAKADVMKRDMVRVSSPPPGNPSTPPLHPPPACPPPHWPRACPDTRARANHPALPPTSPDPPPLPPTPPPHLSLATRRCTMRPFVALKTWCGCCWTRARP